MATDDAKAVITFAHKYALNSLLEASEAFLVELAQADMEDHDDLNYSDDHYHLFTSNQVTTLGLLQHMFNWMHRQTGNDILPVTILYNVLQVCIGICI